MWVEGRKINNDHDFLSFFITTSTTYIYPATHPLYVKKYKRIPKLQLRFIQNVIEKQCENSTWKQD